MLQVGISALQTPTMWISSGVDCTLEPAVIRRVSHARLAGTEMFFTDTLLRGQPSLRTLFAPPQLLLLGEWGSRQHDQVAPQPTTRGTIIVQVQRAHCTTP